MGTPHRALGWLVAGIVASAIALPSPAQACGGFFCNSTPVSQAAERIVFSQQPDGTMRTHIQINYTGMAETFAWILPVPSVPELSVGTDRLFTELERTTAPQFRLDSRTDGVCRDVPECPRRYVPPDPNNHDEYWGSTDASAADAGSPGPPPVSVHFRDAVGPYDAAVISSTDVTAMLDWLSDNEYDIPDASRPLLADYVDDGNVFVALKLLSDRATGEIQPIVLEYREEQPCIPIKLTAIATVPDMPIIAWVLGRSRSVPWNYMDVRPDLDVRELYIGGRTPNLYQNLVSMAVDDAGGHGFVTEYAGPPPEIQLRAQSVEDLRTETDAGAFVMELSRRGFNGDAHLLALLQRFVPPPEWADARQFYNCLVNDWCSEYDPYLFRLPFDADAFVDALNTAIVHPRRDAQRMVDSQPMLTRLFTTMDAEEMTEDPVFVFNRGAENVSNVHTATTVTECDAEHFAFAAPQHLEFPSGATEPLREGIPYVGTDAAYCWDSNHALFGPGVADDVARQTARMRRAHPDVNHRGCSAAPWGAGGGGALLLVALSMVVFARRRRR